MSGWLVMMASQGMPQSALHVRFGVHGPGVDAHVGALAALHRAGHGERAVLGVDGVRAQVLGVERWVDHGLGIEQADLRLRVHPAHQHERIVVEGGVEHAGPQGRSGATISTVFSSRPGRGLRRS